MSSTLCEGCSKVTLDSLRNRHNFIASSYTDLAISAKTNSCSLCNVVFSAFQFKHSRWARPKDAEEEKRNFRFSAISLWTASDTPLDPFGFCEDIFDQKIDSALSRNSRVSFGYGDTLKGGLDAHNADPENPIYAKQTVAAKVDPQLPFVRKCLELCKSEHKEICGVSISRVEGNPPRRLYNIARKFLESFDPEKGEPVEYTALSYLWGSAVTEKIKTLAEGTTKEKLETRWTNGFKDNIPTGSLFSNRVTPGSFDLKDREKYDVPLTYLRAIEITESLGINYIWIDSICIIQDGDKGQDQAHHFGDFAGGVGQIYENAVLTLTAIGPNASVDMYSDRKLYTRDDPRAAYLSDGKIFLTKDGGTFDSPLQPTVLEQDPKGWDSRGWPFQERMLSRRLVYFTQRQQYFECCKIFSENGETSPTHDFRERLRKLHDSPDMLRLWPSIVVDYTPRGLGRYIDRLNGISAVATQMSKRAERLNLSPRLTFNYPSGVFFESLARDLFWILSDDQNTNDYLGLKTPPAGRPTGWKLPPPSWSWGQWKGGIFFPRPLHSVDLNRLPPSQGYGPHSQLTSDDVIIETDQDDGKKGPLRTRLIVKKPRLLQSLVLAGPMEPTENQGEKKLFRGSPRYAFNDYGSPLKFSTLRSIDSGLLIGWAHLDPGMSCMGQKVVGLVISENRNWENEFESWNVMLLARKEDVEHIPEETRPPWATDKTVLAVEDKQYVRVGMGEVWKEELSVGEAIVVG